MKSNVVARDLLGAVEATVGESPPVCDCGTFAILVVGAGGSIEKADVEDTATRAATVNARRVLVAVFVISVRFRCRVLLLVLFMVVQFVMIQNALDKNSRQLQSVPLCFCDVIYSLLVRCIVTSHT